MNATMTHAIQTLNVQTHEALIFVIVTLDSQETGSPVSVSKHFLFQFIDFHAMNCDDK